eukprot:gene6784-13739_t
MPQSTKNINDLGYGLTLPLKWALSLIKDFSYNCLHKNFTSTDTLTFPQADNSDKIIMVTGALGGIGRSLCALLTKCGFPTIILARASKADDLNKFAAKLQHGMEYDCLSLNLDLSALSETYVTEVTQIQQSLRDLNKRGKVLHGIVHNAGIMTGATTRKINIVNAVAPIALSLLLLPELLCSDRPRIIQVTSSSHIRAQAYRAGDLTRSLADNVSMDMKSNLIAYGQSKQRLMLSGEALRKRFQNCRLIVNDVHPGIVNTPMLRGFPLFAGLSQSIMSTFLRSEEEGAKAVIGALLSSEPEQLATPYFVDGRHAPRRASVLAYDPVAAEACFKDTVAAIPTSLRNLICDHIRRSVNSNSKGMSVDRKNALIGLAREVEDIK